MKASFLLLFSFSILFSLPSVSQSLDSTFIGTWKLTKQQQNLKLPTWFTVDFFGDSLFVVPVQIDSLTFTTIVKRDSSSLLLKSVTLDPFSRSYYTQFCSFSISKEGDKIKALYKADAGQEAFKVIEYSFQTECCSGHNPNHCADNGRDLQKLKNNGCTGFYRPK